MTKINLRTTAKGHAHLQTLTKTPLKFQKDPAETVGGKLRSQDFVMDSQSAGQMDAQGKKICLLTLTGEDIIMTKSLKYDMYVKATRSECVLEEYAENNHYARF